MHTPEISKSTNGVKDGKDDGPSVLGHFMWTVVGNSCIPCLLKNDGTKYVSVRIAESKVLYNFLCRLNTEVFNCVSVKSFGITEAEMKLLNEINTKHCEYSFGRDSFTMDTDFIVKYDDLIEFYQFMDTCYNKLVNQTPTTNSKNKCGFVRINDDSVVPYAVKNDQKYVPLFYFEGETDSLKTKAINLENWDLAYLKFCCKVQGIKNELFASEQCLVTSLEDVKSYFPEGTKFDDYWPSKVVEMQTPNRSDVNGNHSWVQTPHVDSSAVPQSIVPTATHTLTNKTIQQSALVKQLQNNQRMNPASVISPSYPQSNAWQTSVAGNNMNSPQPNSYQVSQNVAQQRIAPKQASATVHVMNTSNVAARTYGNQSARTQQQYFNVNTNNVPKTPGMSQQPPPPLVKVHTTSMSNVYSNPISASSYPMYSTPPSYSMSNVQTHHLNSASASQMANKIRNNTPNQVTSNARYPPALTPLASLPTHTSTVPVIGNNMSANNALLTTNRSRSTYNPPGDEIIDLSSPPHSPQHVNTAGIGKMPSLGNVSYGYDKSSYTASNQIIVLGEYTSRNGVNPYKIRYERFGEDQLLPVINLPVINLDATEPIELGVSLYDLHNLLYSKMDSRALKDALLTALKLVLYQPNSTQMQLLRELHKHHTSDDDFLLMKLNDLKKYCQQLAYFNKVAPNKQGGGDAKRQKIS